MVAGKLGGRRAVQVPRSFGRRRWRRRRIGCCGGRTSSSSSATCTERSTHADGVRASPGCALRRPPRRPWRHRRARCRREPRSENPKSRSGRVMRGERRIPDFVDWELIQRLVDRCVGSQPRELADDVRQEVLLSILLLVRARTPVQSWSGLINVLVRRAWSRVPHPPVATLSFEPSAREETPKTTDEAALVHARSVLTDRQFRALERFLGSSLSRTALAHELAMSPTDLREVLRGCAKRLQKSPPSGATLD